jgi:threonine dehydrogenase-like Zn-dependent dehydrogenase
MRAAVYYGPGDIRIEDVAHPGEPRCGELLIRVLKAAICGTDSSEWDHGPILAVPPVILGHEFVGEVVALGDGVSDFVPGDRVVSGAGVSCGECEWCASGRTNLCAEYYTLGLHVNGGLAEFVTSPAFICRRVPDEVTDVAAAMAQPLAVALHGLRRTKVMRGSSIVVIGVGGIGGFLIAGAAARGASPVIAVDIDSERLRSATSLGATHLVNAAEEDVVARVKEITNGLGAQCVIEATGTPPSPQLALNMVRRGGDVLILGLHAGAREINLLGFTLQEVDLHGTLAHVCGDDIPEALEILASSSIADHVLDRVIALEDLMEQGIMPLVQRRARGKIVVDVARSK